MSVATELYLVWGNDIQLRDNYDISLAIDSPRSPNATIQRILRIALTNAATTDSSGAPVTPPDNDMHPLFGGGMRAAIGEPYTPALVAAVAARVVQALVQDPYIASNPAPTVVWSNGPSIGEYFVQINATSVLGEPVSTPSILITAAGATVVGA